MTSAYDIVILGGGPGGYVAAIRAGQLGLKTALVERETVGGVCLNWGCIPSKALLKNAEIVNLLKRGAEFGFSYDNLKVDYSVAVDRSRKVVDRLTRGVGSLLRKHKVDVLKGTGRLASATTIEVTADGQKAQTVTGKNVIIATGARARAIPALPTDGKTVITYREAIVRTQLPKHCVVIGGGAIGCEFAFVYNAYGVKVTVVEMLPRILPNEDAEVSNEVTRSFGKQGIAVMAGTKVTGIEKAAGGVKVNVEGAKGPQALEADLVLVAVGVQPNSENLGLEGVGVRTERGWVQINEFGQTSVPHVWAIGDVTGKLALAHVASHQGVTVVEKIAGKDAQPLEYVYMPRATYCLPQVTSVGLTEEQAKEKGLQYKVGKFPFVANGKALAMGDAEGFVKVIADQKYGEILGVHMVGPEVTEFLGEATLAHVLEATTAELGFTVIAHPSLSEALKEAALAARGEAIHI